MAFLTGKEPLRPIQRIGILLLNGIPLLGMIFFIGPLFVSSLKDAPALVLCLFLPIILLWAMIALAAARIVWAALTAPSQRNYEPSDSTPKMPHWRTKGRKSDDPRFRRGWRSVGNEAEKK